MKGRSEWVALFRIVPFSHDTHALSFRLPIRLGVYFDDALVRGRMVYGGIGLSR